MKIEKIQKLVGNLHDKIEYIMHIRNLKQAKKNHELILKNCIKLLNLIKKSWLRPYIDVNTELTKGKKWFWERFLQIHEQLSFWKEWENIKIPDL